MKKNYLLKYKMVTIIQVNIIFFNFMFHREIYSHVNKEMINKLTQIHKKEGTFENMFTNAYTEYGIMCIGLYRFINLYKPINSCGKDRFVFTNPSPDLQLDQSDLVCFEFFLIFHY